MRIGGTFVSPVTAVRDLGVHLDADVSMTAHARATVRSYMFRCTKGKPNTQCAPFAVARCSSGADSGSGGVVVTKLDYCCSVLVGVSGTLLRRLQSVVNAAARIVFSARRRKRARKTISNFRSQ